MLKTILTLIIFATQPALTQVVSGSIVIINITNDRLVLAADSYGRVEGKSESDDKCKIAALDNKIIFASVGGEGYSAPSGRIFDPVGAWNSTDIARSVTDYYLSYGIFDLTRIADTWADRSLSNWRFLYRIHPETVDNLIRKYGEDLVYGVFAEARDGTIVYEISAIKATGKPVTIDKKNGWIGECWPCGVNAEKVCGLGLHWDVAAKFCSERQRGKRRDDLNTATKLKDADDTTKIPVKIIESILDANPDQSTAGVGGSIDAITLRSNGSITWNAIKKQCRQD